MMRVCVEKCPGRGEDAYAAGENFVVACDGVGYSGRQMRTHEDGRKWTEARIASRAAAAALKAGIPLQYPLWAQRLAGAPGEARGGIAEEIAGQCRAMIQEALLAEKAAWNMPADERVMLPTTVAAWIDFPDVGGEHLALALWAGDSRCYVLTDSAMRLHTRDDVDEAGWLDPMDELLAAGSPPMNNSACVDADWTLHARLVPVTGRALLVSCSDGAYGYLDSPMHFEYILRLCSAYETAEEMNRELAMFFAEASGDDTTLLGLYTDPQQGGMPALRGMLGAGLGALYSDYIEAFPQRPERTAYYDLDQELSAETAAMTRLDAFERALRAYVLEQAKRREPVDKGLPCAGVIQRMRSVQETAVPSEKTLACVQTLGLVSAELDGAIDDLRVMEMHRLAGYADPYAWWTAFSGYAPRRSRVNGEMQRIANHFMSFTEKAIVVNRTSSVRSQRKLQQASMEIQKDLFRWLAIMKEGFHIGFPYADVSAEMLSVRERPLSEMEKRALRRQVETGGAYADADIPQLRMTLAQADTLDALGMRLDGAQRALQAARQADACRIEQENMELLDAYVKRNLHQEVRWFICRWLEDECMPDCFQLEETAREEIERIVHRLARLKALNRQSDERFIRYREEIRELWRRYSAAQAEDEPADKQAAQDQPEAEDATDAVEE